MAQIKSIKTGDHKGFKSNSGLKVGHVSVISGPNNSGKTTVFEAIDSSTNRKFSLDLEGDFVEVIWEPIKNSLAHLNLGDEKWEQIKTVALMIAKGQVLCYSNETGRFAASLVKKLSDNGVLNLPSEYIEIPIDQVFNKISILIPSKRKIDSRKDFSSKEDITPSGVGLLREIFEAKNQSRDSVLRLRYEKLEESFRSISGGCRFDLTLEGKTICLKFNAHGNQWFSAEDCGLGLQDLLIILYFIHDPIYDLFLIEEPESHLHPDAQRRLKDFIKGHKDKQFLISTHSSVFLSTDFADIVYGSKYLDGKITVENVTSRAEMLTSLGYSILDNLCPDLIILCEGPKDRLCLLELLKKKGLDKFDIKIWPLGGDIMGQLDLSAFKANANILALLDLDPESSAIREKFMESCMEIGISVTRLQRYAIENYLNLGAIEKVMNQKSKVTTLNPLKRAKDQLGFEVKNQAHKIFSEMPLTDLEGTDLMEFLDGVERALVRESK